MTLNIGNNTQAGSIANPDYWSPSFSLDGCVYAGLYHLDDLSKNLAGDNSPSTVIGEVVRDGLFPRFNSGNFKLVTGVTVGNGPVSIVCLYNKSTATPASGSAPGRGYLVTSYGGGNNGVSLTVEGAANTPNPSNIAAYRAAADNPTAAIFSSGASSASADGWALSGMDSSFDVDGTTARVNVRNYLTSGSAGGTGTNKPGWAVQTAPIAVGGRPLAADGSSLITIAAVLVYERVLSATDRTDILNYFRQYLANRGIVL